MLFVTILTSDRARDPELWATIWQGNAPPSLNLIGAYNLGSNKRVFIWEGESAADLQFMDRFNEVGVLETSPAFDRTFGWQCAFKKDIEGFATNLRERARKGLTAAFNAEAGIDLRRRAINAANRDAARATARQWHVEQQDAPGD